MIDESAEDLDGAMHGCVVECCPVGLIPVVDVDNVVGVFAIEEVGETLGMVFDYGLQELLMQSIEFFPVIGPEWFEDAALFLFPLGGFDGIFVDLLYPAIWWSSAAI